MIKQSILKTSTKKFVIMLLLCTIIFEFISLPLYSERVDATAVAVGGAAYFTGEELLKLFIGLLVLGGVVSSDIDINWDEIGFDLSSDAFIENAEYNMLYQSYVNEAWRLINMEGLELYEYDYIIDIMTQYDNLEDACEGLAAALNDAHDKGLDLAGNPYQPFDVLQGGKSSSSGNNKNNKKDPFYKGKEGIAVAGTFALTIQKIYKQTLEDIYFDEKVKLANINSMSQDERYKISYPAVGGPTNYIFFPGEYVYCEWMTEDIYERLCKAKQYAMYGKSINGSWKITDIIMSFEGDDSYLRWAPNDSYSNRLLGENQNWIRFNYSNNTIQWDTWGALSGPSGLMFYAYNLPQGFGSYGKIDTAKSPFIKDLLYPYKPGSTEIVTDVINPIGDPNLEYVSTPLEIPENSPFYVPDASNPLKTAGQTKQKFDNALDTESDQDVVNAIWNEMQNQSTSSLENEDKATQDLIDELTQSSEEKENIKTSLEPYTVSGLGSKFPFCIPFDLINCIKILSAEGEAPRWEIPFKFESFGIDEVIVIDLSKFETVAAVARWCETLLFIAFLIVKTRGLIKG